MRVLALAMLAGLVLVPAGSSRAHGSITAAQARAADAKITQAITEERDALAHASDKGVRPHVFLYASIDRLHEAAAALGDATGSAPIVQEIRTAAADDRAAIEVQGETNLSQFFEYVRKALALKKKAQAALAAYEVGGTGCESEKAFPLYAIPAGFAGAYTDVYPHNVPENAHNIQIRFVDANGHPAPKSPFPGQTWKAKIVGFTTRGGERVLHVHIDVTGTGIGKPDQKFVNWKVIVTWDC